MNRQLYEELGLHLQFGETQKVSFLQASANGRSTAEIEAATRAPGDAAYTPCAEATPLESTPKGHIETITAWTDSNIYPNTSRTISVYRPVITDVNNETGLLVCFDGSSYLDPQGPVRTANVLDNLIHAGSIPPMVGIFVDPGLPAGLRPEDLTGPHFDDAKRMAADQRSIEYDSLCDTNARFVTDELLPLAEQLSGMKVNTTPNTNIVCGMSSGGIAAFTAAWRRPDLFGNVLSHCGSYVNLRGGHNYPYLVRTTQRKALRVYLQSGEQDADITFGSWPLANQQMAAALKFAGYDYHFEYGTGGHTLRHAGALFAHSLRWLVKP